MLCINTVTDPELELARAQFSFYFPCQPFSLVSVLLFLLKIRKRGGGGFSQVPPLDLPLLHNGLILPSILQSNSMNRKRNTLIAEMDLTT